MGHILWNKYAWSVLAVAFFALSEAFVHFVMAVVAILVEIIVLIDDHRNGKREEEQSIEIVQNGSDALLLN